MPIMAHTTNSFAVGVVMMIVTLFFLVQYMFVSAAVFKTARRNPPFILIGVHVS